MDKFPLAASGWRYILSTAFLAAVGSSLGAWWLSGPLWIITAWMTWFFRDPSRNVSTPESALICPADGRVVAVEEVDCPELPGGRALLVSVFMNIFDVHVNRAPISGGVVWSAHRAGAFHPADQARVCRQNERQEVLLRRGDGALVLVVQVAGLVARRIECWLTPGEMVRRGQRFGMIRFGSRVDLYLPLQARVVVEPGQKVRAGITVMGEI